MKRNAVSKSRALLLKHLTQEQFLSEEMYGYFTVLGSNGVRYSINNPFRYPYNVWGDGKCYCAGPRELFLLEGDYRLGQKIMLEHNAELFLEVANCCGII